MPRRIRCDGKCMIPRRFRQSCHLATRARGRVIASRAERSTGRDVPEPSTECHACLRVVQRMCRRRRRGAGADHFDLALDLVTRYRPNWLLAARVQAPRWRFYGGPRARYASTHCYAHGGPDGTPCATDLSPPTEVAGASSLRTSRNARAVRRHLAISAFAPCRAAGCKAPGTGRTFCRRGWTALVFRGGTGGGAKRQLPRRRAAEPRHRRRTSWSAGALPWHRRLAQV